MHEWIYRNPASRTCEICGENQDFYCYPWDFEKIRPSGTWEKMYPLVENPCRPRKTRFSRMIEYIKARF